MTTPFDKVLFYVDAGSIVSRVILLDAQGGRNRFDFVAAKVDVPVAPAQFHIDPPPGVSFFVPPNGAPPPVVPYLSAN